MPITKAENERLRSHTFSEDKKEEFNATHLVIPTISISDTLRHSLGILKSKPSVLFINIVSSLILAIYIYFMFEASTLTNLLWYTVVFFVLEILVVAPLGAISKSKLSNIKITSLISPIIISLNYLEPLISVMYIFLILLIIQNLTFINLFSTVIFVALSIIILLIGIVLHICNLNSAILVVFLSTDLKQSISTTFPKFVD